jgi:RNA polymerase sigma-70 factor (ECF subfamily)
VTDDGSTYWSLIRDAAAGSENARSEFARRYEPVARACLAARWRGTPLFEELDDAVQEVFVDCFKAGGALGRADPDQPGGFRAFFYGVIRNVARNLERARARRRVAPARKGLDEAYIPDDGDGLATVFDKAWATAMLREAGRRFAAAARAAGGDAARRAELLDLRFREGLPIREIADRFRVDPAKLHHEYARARREFRDVLLEVVRWHHPGPPRSVERECSRLLDCFS